MLKSFAVYAASSREVVVAIRNSNWHHAADGIERFITVKMDGTYHWNNNATATLAYWTTTGDYSAAQFGYNGKPDNNGFIAQASYLPWQNTKLTAQYTAYNKFDGLASGSSASDFNTLFLQAWLMW
jgi:hypothetical protein